MTADGTRYCAPGSPPLMTFRPSAVVRLSDPARWPTPARRLGVGPMKSRPVVRGHPATRSVNERPPTRSRPSQTAPVTVASPQAAASLAKPAPTTTTSVHGGFARSINRIGGSGRLFRLPSFRAVSGRRPGTLGLANADTTGAEVAQRLGASAVQSANPDGRGGPKRPVFKQTPALHYPVAVAA